MYVIKMEDDKSLVTTVHADIYRGEKNADTLIFIVPKAYDTLKLASCEAILRYILPDDEGKSETLTMYPLPYNDTYYQYMLKKGSEFTDVDGEIELWLTFLDMASDAVLKSAPIIIEILPAKNIEDYFSEEERSQLDELSLRLEELDASKADNITYDADENTLQLMSGASLIGDEVDMNHVVTDATEDSGINDVIEFDDENLEEEDPDEIIKF